MPLHRLPERYTRSGPADGRTIKRTNVASTGDCRSCVEVCRRSSLRGPRSNPRNLELLPSRRRTRGDVAIASVCGHRTAIRRDVAHRRQSLARNNVRATHTDVRAHSSDPSTCQRGRAWLISPTTERNSISHPFSLSPSPSLSLDSTAWPLPLFGRQKAIPVPGLTAILTRSFFIESTHLLCARPTCSLFRPQPRVHPAICLVVFPSFLSSPRNLCCPCRHRLLSQSPRATSLSLSSSPFLFFRISGLRHAISHDSAARASRSLQEAQCPAIFGDRVLTARRSFAGTKQPRLSTSVTAKRMMHNCLLASDAPDLPAMLKTES